MKASPVVYLNGFFVPLEDAKVSILDRGFTYGDAIFETLRSYDGKVYRLTDHLKRLYENAQRIHLDIPLTQKEIEAVIHATLKANRNPEAYIRLTVSRGEGNPGLLIDPDQLPTLIVLVMPFKPIPAQLYRDGVTVALFENAAQKTSGLTRQVKSCNYLSQILVRESAERKQAREGILLDADGYITEGTTSNIFIVKDGQLLTPPINEYVLAGVTRQVVLELARKLGIPFSERPLSRSELYDADEAFLTNTSIEILPVTRADHSLIGAGVPGDITNSLRQAFLKTT